MIFRLCDASRRGLWLHNITLQASLSPRHNMPACRTRHEANIALKRRYAALICRCVTDAAIRRWRRLPTIDELCCYSARAFIIDDIFAASAACRVRGVMMLTLIDVTPLLICRDYDALYADARAYTRYCFD